MEEFHTGNTHGPLFYTVIKGEKGRMSTRNVERLVKKYADILRSQTPGVPESIYPHMFRRTRARGLYQDGVDISLISKVLGHSSIETTKDHYAIPSLEQKKAAMEKGSSCEPRVQQEQMGRMMSMSLPRFVGWHKMVIRIFFQAACVKSSISGIL